jgi:hypothetical protein
MYQRHKKKILAFTFIGSAAAAGVPTYIYWDEIVEALSAENWRENPMLREFMGLAGRFWDGAWQFCTMGSYLQRFILNVTDWNATLPNVTLTNGTGTLNISCLPAGSAVMTSSCINSTYHSWLPPVAYSAPPSYVSFDYAREVVSGAAGVVVGSLATLATACLGRCWNRRRGGAAVQEDGDDYAALEDGDGSPQSVQLEISRSASINGGAARGPVRISVSQQTREAEALRMRLAADAVDPATLPPPARSSVSQHRQVQDLLSALRGAESPIGGPPVAVPPTVAPAGPGNQVSFAQAAQGLPSVSSSEAAVLSNHLD